MPRFIHERAKHILAKNPDMNVNTAFAVATQQSHALGKSPKDYGTEEGRRDAKAKYDEPKSMKRTANPGHLKTEKLGFVEALPTLTGLATGYGPGRSVAGETAAAIAPQGRVHRSEAMARNAAVLGAPIGGLVAMGLARKHRFVPRLAQAVKTHFPEGLIAEPEVEQELVRLGIPGVAAITGSLAGGAATGGLVGGVQALRGPLAREKTSALKPSPMWGTIGGQAKLPAWRAQAGFTPTGMSTPAQRLQKSMGTAKFDRDKGLKPLDLGKMQREAQNAALGVKTAAPTAEGESESRPNLKRFALGQGLGMAAGLGANLAGMKGLQQWEVEASAPGASELLEKVRGEAKVPIHQPPFARGAFYVPKNERGMGITQFHDYQGLGGVSEVERRAPHIIVPQKAAPAALAHEITHSNIDKTRLGRLIQHPRYNRFVSGPGAQLAAAGLGLATGGSEDERIRNAGIAGAGLLTAPNLVSEGLANVGGYQRLKRLGATPEQLAQARRSLSLGMGTYLGRAGATAAGALAMSGVAGAVGDKVRKQRAAQNAATNVKMGAVMLAITKAATEADRSDEKEDAEFGDEKDPPIAKAAEDGMVHGGFSTNQYSGVMNPPAMVYRSGIPAWREPPVKTAGPPSEKKAELSPYDDPQVQALNAKWDRRALIGGGIGALGGGAAGHFMKVPVHGALMGGFLGAGIGGLTVENERQQAIHDALARLREEPIKEAEVGLTPLSRLNSARRVGAPKLSAPPGPSIAQISKPPGIGRPMSGATKGNHTI